eukprot:3416144-Pyramimonas_sp.AAC.1
MPHKAAAGPASALSPPPAPPRMRSGKGPSRKGGSACAPTAGIGPIWSAGPPTQLARCVPAR